MRDDGRATGTLSALIQRHQSSTQQQCKPPQSPVKVPRLDLSLVSSGSVSSGAGALWNSTSRSFSSMAGAAGWEAIVTDRAARQAFLALNSPLSPHRPQFPPPACSSDHAASPPSTKIFDLTQPRKVPVPPPAHASADHNPSPLLGGTARKLLHAPPQPPPSPRRFLISVDGPSSASASNIAELHQESEQRLLHVILTPGVLSREIAKSGFGAGDEGGGATLSDVNRLAKRMFPSLHPSISCASVAPAMCGIVDEGVNLQDVAALLLAMVYSSFVADVLGKEEVVTKEALMHCIMRLNISQSAKPETCDGLLASALADSPGAHSSELFCLWFVKMHMAIMIGKIVQKDPKLSLGLSPPAEVHRQEILYMLRLHSNSAIAHLRDLNTCINGSCKQQQQQQKKQQQKSGRGSSRDVSRSPTSRPTTALAAASSLDTSRALAEAESERKSTRVNSARTCISANMHLIRCAMRFVEIWV
jgi:hypothetical protein